MALTTNTAAAGIALLLTQLVQTHGLLVQMVDDPTNPENEQMLAKQFQTNVDLLNLMSARINGQK